MEKEIKMGFLETLFQVCFAAFVFSTAFAVPIALVLFIALDEIPDMKRVIMISVELTAFIVLSVVFYIGNKKYRLR